mgnify:CR=1 FL=1
MKKLEKLGAITCIQKGTAAAAAAAAASAAPAPPPAAGAPPPTGGFVRLGTVTDTFLVPAEQFGHDPASGHLVAVIERGGEIDLAQLDAAAIETFYGRRYPSEVQIRRHVETPTLYEVRLIPSAAPAPEAP